jgi:S1-C subfamily serine protease
MWLTVRTGEDRGTSVCVNGSPVVIGRDDGCDLVVRDGRASRRHASLTAQPDGRVELRDLGSGNGTFLDGERIETAVLAGGEQIQIGETVLLSSREDPARGPAATILGEAPRRQSQSAIQRIMLQRSVRRATLLSGAAIGLAVVIAVLFITGVLPPGGNGRDAVQRVVARATPSTVLVEGMRGAERAETGTGWVLDARHGLIVTNAHVINDGVSFQVGVDGELRPAEVVGAAPCEDLAVLRVAKTAGLRTLPLGNQATLRLGETVVALGFPGNASDEASLTSTTGVVSVARSTYREAALDIPRYPNVVQTDAAINPGNSGGPLLDLDGRLIGVNSAGRTLSPTGRIIQGQNYAIGVDRVRQVTGRLRTGRSIGWTGLSFEYPTPRELEARGLPPGLLVGPAVRGTAAARSHLRRGSLVVAVDRKPVNNSLASYCDAVGGLPSGRRVRLDVLERGGAKARRVILPLE